MQKNKFRLLLVVTFAVAAGIIISTKINNTIGYTTPEETVPVLQKETTAKTNKTAPVSKIKADVILAEEKRPSNYLGLIPECLNIQVNPDDTLKNIVNQNKWMSKDPKNLIRQNLVYKINNKELRISVMPTETNKNWTLQSFDVDSEGLPIPKNKILGLQYHQLADKIKTESNGATLISDEQNLLVKTPENSGSILFINDQPVQIKLFNKSDQRMLECQGNYCLCNQALSS